VTGEITLQLHDELERHFRSTLGDPPCQNVKTKTGRQLARSAEETASTEYDMNCALKAHSASLFNGGTLHAKLSLQQVECWVHLGKHGKKLAGVRITNSAGFLSHMLRTVPALPKAAACAFSGSAGKD